MKPLGSLLFASLLTAAPGCLATEVGGSAPGADAGAPGSDGGDDVIPGTDASAGDPDAGPAGPPPLARVLLTERTGLNLRAAASGDAEVLATMPDGTVVEITGPDQGVWRPLRYGDIEGYAHTDFLVDIAEAEMGGYLNLLPWQAGETMRVSQGHNGDSHTGKGSWAWDFAMIEGTPLYAVHNGVVRRSKTNSTTGGCSSSYAADANYVVLDRGDGFESLYLHLKSTRLKPGDVVTRGQLVGRSGQTGYSCGPHLHFQIQYRPGDGESGYQQSIREYFYDTGEPLDPPDESYPESQNTSDNPRPVAPDLDPGAETTDPSFEPHGGDPSWDRVMSSIEL